MVKLIETLFFRCIYEYDRSIVHKPARRDRAMMGVLNRSMRNAGCDSHPLGLFRLLLLLTVRGMMRKRNRE